MNANYASQSWFLDLSVENRWLIEALRAAQTTQGNTAALTSNEIHYTGATEELQCTEGFYNNLWHQEACFPCLQGFYCSGLGRTDDYTPCPTGAYCIA